MFDSDTDSQEKDEQLLLRDEYKNGKFAIIYSCPELYLLNPNNCG